MALSKLEVWNDALFLLGTSRINDTAPVDEATRTLNEAWRPVVLTCLEQGDFDCAKKRDALSRVEPAPAFGWSYYYDIPADCLRLVFVSQSGLPDDPLLRYAVEDGKIAADATTLYAIWVSSTAVEATGKWSANLARFVAASLAERCLKLNPGAADMVQMALKKAKPSAESVDAVQNPPSFRRPGRWASSIRGFRNPEQGR